MSICRGREVGGQWVGELACWAAHPGAFLPFVISVWRLCPRRRWWWLVACGSGMRRWYLHPHPSKGEGSGGVRSDLGDVALASSLGVGNGWWWWWEEEAVWHWLVFLHLATTNIVGKIWLGSCDSIAKILSLSPNSGHIICYIYVFCAPHIF